MQQPATMTTLSEVLEKLNRKGIENEIVMNDANEMVSTSLDKKYQPDDLLIFKAFRFESDSDPADNSVLFMMEDQEGYILYLIDCYGPYSNYGSAFDDFLKRIPVEDRLEQLCCQ